MKKNLTDYYENYQRKGILHRIVIRSMQLVSSCSWYPGTRAFIRSTPSDSSFVASILVSPQTSIECRWSLQLSTSTVNILASYIATPLDGTISYSNIFCFLRLPRSSSCACAFSIFMLYPFALYACMWVVFIYFGVIGDKFELLKPSFHLNWQRERERGRKRDGETLSSINR